MHIALLTHKVDRMDGQGRVNFEIARYALEQGHTVTIFAEYCSPLIADHPRGHFVPSRARSIPTQLLRNLHYAAVCARWLGQHRDEFDVVQANGFVTWARANVVAVHFVHSAWLAGPQFPFQWRSFSPYAYYQRLLTMMNGYFERKAFREADRLIAVSSFTAGEVTSLGIPANKTIVINNGVDLAEFSPGPADRSSFKLPEGVPLALFVGDIKTSRKNLEAVLKCMQRVQTLHLAVAGSVEGSPYPEMAAALGVAGRVTFLGKISNIPGLMRSADFFVFPSRYEAQPLVLLESLASGLPIIVSNSFHAADYVRDAGIVYQDPDDLDQLTAAIRTMLDDPEACRQMALKARTQALTMDWTSMAARYLAVYEDLVRRGDRNRNHA